MINPISVMRKEGAEEENIKQYASEILELEEENFGSRRYRTISDSEKTLILNVGRSRTSASCRELYFHQVHSFHNSIPKHITTFDEKYVFCCLELIRNSALRASFNFASKVDILPDSGALVETNSRIMAIECPLAVDTDIFINSTGGWAIGTISGSQSMVNILNSPLLQNFGTFECSGNFGGNLQEASEPVHSDFSDSPQENKVVALDRKLLPAPAHRRVVSMSSTNSSGSDQSSSSTCSSFQAMLQCSWKNGLPYHVFSVDDKREVYVAKVQSLDDKVLDYVYSFHSRRNLKRESSDLHENDFDSVGTMRVSTVITLCPDNSEVKETQFILSVCNDDPSETQAPTQNLKKNKRLTRKVVDVFRTSHTYRQRSNSKFGGSSAIFEDTPWEPSEDMDKGHLDLGWEGKYAPNLEMAAIILKETRTTHKEDDPGGWGLKFLKKSGKSSTMETARASGCARNNGECSTSMNVVIPAGFHGGPRTRVGGPSSLMERWISGGNCDCGGWDLGCPLTVLKTKLNSVDSSTGMENAGECKSIDLFIQGSIQEVAAMKMVNIHDGLYYINFQSTLSTLQCFAIATAIFHCQTPLLRPKMYRS